MNLIWEVVLRAKEENISLNNIRFERAEKFSPYLEVINETLNFNGLTPTIQINPYFRFNNIFDSLVDNYDENIETKSAFFDIILHLIATLDVKSGLSKKDYYGLFLKRDMDRNSLEFTEYDALSCFPYSQRRYVLESLVKLYTTGFSLKLLETLLQRLYPHSIIYLDTVDKRTLLLYLGQEKTKELEKQVEFLISAFLPIDFDVELFWEMHFGIFDVNETMIMEEFVIF